MGSPLPLAAGECASTLGCTCRCRALQPRGVCLVSAGAGGGCALMTASRREIVELWQRAQEALRATSTLLAAGFPDFAAARAYYAAFYAASALLLAEGKTFRSHRGWWHSSTETMSEQGACLWTWAELSVRCPTCGVSEIMAVLPMSVTPRPT